MGKATQIVHVVGARPNFMKAAPVIDETVKIPNFEVKLVHTGQHYDKSMSTFFFEELGLPQPQVNLEVGSGSHAEQTGTIMIRFEKVLQKDLPALVVVYGDVNSTIACSLVCAKLGVPIAHVEAGLRSFDRSMPEEINRILTDQLSTYLFTTEESANKNLMAEGIASEKVFFVGNTMVDTLMRYRSKAQTSTILKTLGLTPKKYALVTLHRPRNVDCEETFQSIMETLANISKQVPVVFPCHPRTRTRLSASHITVGNIHCLDPLGYLDFLCLMSQAKMVLTDSGGIQEETTVLSVPCLTLRDNTERPITVTQGTNKLLGSSRERILAAVEEILSGEVPKGQIPDLWDGCAAERIAAVLTSHLVSPAPVSSSPF